MPELDLSRAAKVTQRAMPESVQLSMLDDEPEKKADSNLFDLKGESLIEEYVKELRKQSVLNGISLKTQKQRLFEKAMEKRRYWSERRKQETALRSTSYLCNTAIMKLFCLCNHLLLIVIGCLLLLPALCPKFQIF